MLAGVGRVLGGTERGGTPRDSRQQSGRTCLPLSCPGVKVKPDATLAGSLITFCLPNLARRWGVS